MSQAKAKLFIENSLGRQQVEHIPVDVDIRRTRLTDAHYLMRLCTERGWVTTPIRADRIIRMEVTDYGLMGHTTEHPE